MQGALDLEYFAHNEDLNVSSITPKEILGGANKLTTIIFFKGGFFHRDKK